MHTTTPESPLNPLSRRHFLQITTLAAVGATLGPLTAAHRTPADYPIGCYTRCFDQHEYRVALDAIAEAGYKYAGIMTAKGDPWVIITPKTTLETATRIAGDLKQRDLKALSVFADFSVSQSLEQGITELRHIIDCCALCGSPGLLLGGTGDEKLYPLYIKAIRESCDYAASKAVLLTIKPHGGKNATGPQCRKMIEQVAHQQFRAWYDPGNIFYYSEGALNPVEDCPSIADLVVGMSVKDYQRPKEVLVNPGDGEVDFHAVFTRLKQGGFKRGPLVVECLARAELKTVIAAAIKTRLFLEHLTGAKG
ncbi:MAG TPA: TIM barrel protein [Clostridia bacterium]|nr:TIM barrel protein [Clostridia bacterium]